MLKTILLISGFVLISICSIHMTYHRSETKDGKEQRNDSLINALYVELAGENYYTKNQFQCNSVLFDSCYFRADTSFYSFNWMECEILGTGKLTPSGGKFFIESILDTIAADYRSNQITKVNYFLFVPSATNSKYSKHAFKYPRRITALILAYLMDSGIKRSDIDVKINIAHTSKSCTLSNDRENVIKLYCH